MTISFHALITLTVILLIFFSSCSAKNCAAESFDDELIQNAVSTTEPSEATLSEVERGLIELAQTKVARDTAVSNFISSLSLIEQAAQLFIVNLEGDEIFTPVEWAGDSPNRALVPGGYIFFSYNIADAPETIIDFTNAIQSYCAERNIIPPYLTLDQEGGDVCRLRNVAGKLPSGSRVAVALSTEDAYTLYLLQARQMRALGFVLNLAPVAEVGTFSNAAFLEGRSFGDADAVKTYGATAIDAFRASGVSATLKHFPGNTNSDPHFGIPEIIMSEAEFNKVIFEPFSYLANCKPAAILMSHARVSLGDGEADKNSHENAPACLSRKWVTEMVREKIGFDGLIISDDIFMAALAENGWPPEKAVVSAIEAGVDIIMISEKRFAFPLARLVKEAEANPSFAVRIAESCRRVIDFKIAHNILVLSETDSVLTVSIPRYSDEERAVKKKRALADFNAAKEENERFYEKHFLGGTRYE